MGGGGGHSFRTRILLQVIMNYFFRISATIETNMIMILIIMIMIDYEICLSLAQIHRSQGVRRAAKSYMKCVAI